MDSRLYSLFASCEFHFDKIAPSFPELLALNEVDQNPVYHGEGNVYLHTWMVCDVLRKSEEFLSLQKEEQTALYLAAMFHDIGKRVTTRMEQGALISPRHAVKGEQIFRELWYCKYEKQYQIGWLLREQATLLIRFHGLPLFFMEKEQIEYELLLAAECVDMKLLYQLGKADLLGRLCKDQSALLDRVDYFKEYTEELKVWNGPGNFANAYTKFRYFKDRTHLPKDVLYDSSSFEVVLMAGLPLAGKDTYVHTQYWDWPVVCMDDIREEWGILPTVRSGEVAAEARKRAREFLRKKQPFVWNATNIVRDTRQKLIQLFDAYGARVTIIYVETPYECLLGRNQTRERTVPANVIWNMIRKLDMPRPSEAYKLRCILGDGME